MPLQSIEITPSRAGYSPPREIGMRNARLRATAEPLVNALAYALRPAKLAMPDRTTRVILYPREIAPDPAGPKVMGKNLDVPIDLDWARYEAVEQEPQGVGAFHTDLFRRGLEGLDPLIPGLGKIANPVFAEFETAGYRFCWAPCKPARGPDRVEARLEACIDPFAFRLWLRVTRCDQSLFDAVILEDQTDPLYWHHKFKGLKWHGTEVHVTPRSPADGPPLFVLDTSA